MDDQTNGLESRRSVIRKLGAGAGAATLGLGATESSLAKQKDSAFPDTNFVEETGTAKERAIQTAVESDEYTTISNELFNTEWEIGDRSDATVIRVETPENDVRHVVDTGLDNIKTPRIRTRRTSRSSSDFTSGGASFAIIDQEVTSAKVTFEKTEWGGTKVVSAQMNSEFPGSEITASMKSIDVDGYSTTAETTSLTRNISNIDGVSAQETNKCWACKLIGDVICSVGCGVSGAAICLAAGVSGPQSSLGCGAIVTIFCGILLASSERFVGTACEVDHNVERICYYGDLCADKPYMPDA